MWVQESSKLVCNKQINNIETTGTVVDNKKNVIGRNKIQYQKTYKLNNHWYEEYQHRGPFEEM